MHAAQRERLNSVAFDRISVTFETPSRFSTNSATEDGLGPIGGLWGMFIDFAGIG